MKLHLVGGFLGSGKTTAITNSAIKLKNSGITTGVITNDQGNYLVDSNFSSSMDIPTGEVTGGCFCCNYNDLDNQIQQLIKDKNPKVIFGESVGSCTDLVATVLKPLYKNRENELNLITLSIFVDSRLLLKFLQNKDIGFSEEILYIFEKQIEEAEILIINKVDLLSSEQLELLKQLTEKNIQKKVILFQNSLDAQSIENWLNTIENYNELPVDKTMDIDYQIYGKGEANLAWLDEEIEITGPMAYYEAIHIIEKIVNQITYKKLKIGHVKFLISNTKQSEKISFTTISGNDWKENLSFFEGEKIVLMVNARVETTPELLRKIVYTIVKEINEKEGIDIQEHCVSAFQPGFPNPTYRISN